MLDRVLKVIYIAGVVAEIVIRMPYDRERRRQHLVVDRADAQERGLFGLLTLGMVAVPAVWMLTRWLDRANYRWPPTLKAIAGGAGTLLLGGALWLFSRAHADLGRNWSPSLQVREDHTLVTEGIYRYIRHPMYASQVLWTLAQPLLLQNWIAGWVGPLTFVPFYLLRVPREEQLMREQFGAQYEAYAERTGSILPRL
jgi:protein-S-isoprenylcysteine O-methyltransferase Ste14